jgi:hypothetical protein
LTLQVSKNGRPPAERAKEILATLGTKVLGVVVNGAHRGRGARGYGSDNYRYGYNYGYGYDYYDYSYAYHADAGGYYAETAKEGEVSSTSESGAVRLRPDHGSGREVLRKERAGRGWWRWLRNGS